MRRVAPSRTARIVVGRADLVIEYPGREGVVIDFEADKAASGVNDVSIDCVLQLEAYRMPFESAGYRVRKTGLL